MVDCMVSMVVLDGPVFSIMGGMTVSIWRHQLVELVHVDHQGTEVVTELVDTVERVEDRTAQTGGYVRNSVAQHAMVTRIGPCCRRRGGRWRSPQSTYAPSWHATISLVLPTMSW